MKENKKISPFQRRVHENCALCGKAIRGKYNRDHILPKAIAKWCLDEDTSEVVSIIYNPRNMVHTHIHCNSQKAERLVPISSLHIPKCRKKYLEESKKKLTRYINKYNHLKADVIREQNGKCLCCDNPLVEGYAILRRYDCTKERTRENAAVVCDICNAVNIDFTHTNRRAG